MSNAHEAQGDERQQKACEECVGLQRHHLLPMPLATIAIGEADVAVTDIDQTMVSNRDAVRVPAEILQDLLGAGPRWLGVDDPLLRIELIKIGGEALRRPQLSQLGGERQLPAGRQLVEGLEELGAEDRAQCVDGEEEARMCWDPLSAVGCQGTTWDQAMDMEVGIQELIPRVQDHCCGHLAAEILVSELQERL